MNNYVEKDEITLEILNIQKREKVRKIINDIETLEKNSILSNEDIENLNLLKKEKEKLINEGADPNYNRQRFGEIVLMISDNLLKKPCFRSYSENWTEDFKSNAIYKIFRYINNFDPEKTSKITGKKISSFAYLTQITYMAFVEVINKQKKDDNDIANNIIPLQKLSDVYNKQNNISRYYPDEHKVDDTDYYVFLSVDDFKCGDKICTTLYEVLSYIRNNYIKLNIEKPKIHVTYPADYRISMDEYNLLNGLDFELMSIVKPKEKDPELENDISSEECFVFEDEEFEDWGEWTIESDK